MRLGRGNGVLLRDTSPAQLAVVEKALAGASVGSIYASVAFLVELTGLNHNSVARACKTLVRQGKAEGYYPDTTMFTKHKKQMYRSKG